jgi:hypothetical protein
MDKDVIASCRKRKWARYAGSLNMQRKGRMEEKKKENGIAFDYRHTLET